MKKIGCLGFLGIAAAVFVVAAVIYPLLVMLVPGSLPIFDYPREKAQERKCMANLRMIGRAIALYEDDYESIMPWGSGSKNWSDLAKDYVKAVWDNGSNYEEGMDTLLDCPSVPHPNDQLTTYGYNRYLGKMKRAQNPLIVLPVKVKYPALTIRITETLRPQPNAFPEILDSRIEGTFAPVPDWKAAGLSGPLYTPGWHNGRNNVLWVDGHVSTMTKEEVMLSDSNSDPNVWARLSPKPRR